MRNGLAGLLLLVIALGGCITEPGTRLISGTIVDRQDGLAPDGFPPMSDITVWPENGNCQDGARIYIGPTTKVRIGRGSFVRDTNWTVLTVGRFVTARISTSGEMSCPIGTGAKYIHVD